MFRTASAATRAWPRAGQGAQVNGGVIVEPEGTGQGVEDVIGGVTIAALFQTDVVVGADAGKHRELLAPQAGYTSPAVVRDARVLGTDELAPCP